MELKVNNKFTANSWYHSVINSTVELAPRQDDAVVLMSSSNASNSVTPALTQYTTCLGFSPAIHTLNTSQTRALKARDPDSV